MKSSLKLLLTGVFFIASMMLIGTLSAQSSIDSVSMLVKSLLSPPKLQGLSIADAFTQASTYFAAIVTFCFIYLSQWVPGVKQFLAKIPSGYLRALVLGGAMLWVIVANGGLYDTQAIVAFIFSNVIWEVVKNLLPPAPVKQVVDIEDPTIGIGAAVN